MFCKPTKVLPAIVHPTKCKTLYHSQNVIQPQIHPAHTNIVKHTNIQNQHYFPQTQSVAKTYSTQNVYGGPGPGPAVAGAYAPGYGPGPAVAGAHAPGYGPAVAGANIPYGRRPR